MAVGNFKKIRSFDICLDEYIGKLLKQFWRGYLPPVKWIPKSADGPLKAATSTSGPLMDS